MTLLADISDHFISLPKLIAERARQQPHAIALSAASKKPSRANQTLSYADLDRTSAALAAHLRALGVGAETRVAVCLSRGPSLFVALLAVLRAGGAYVPLDPAFPAERLTFLQRDAGVALLLTETGVMGRIPRVESVTLINLDELSLPDAVTESEITIHPEQLAYVIYTSGSTGTPKGVAVSHAALSLHMQAIAELYGLTASDRLLHFISVSFDGAGEAWLAPLIRGATVVIGDPTSWTPSDINAALVDDNISIVGVSPAVLLHMAEAWREAGRVGVPPVRSYTVGGEAISREAFARIRDIFNPPRLFNGYGPTETVVTPLLWQWHPTTEDSAWNTSAYLPIGSPVGARTAYVLDADLNEVPVGVAGELFLGGLLARGYHARPALTAERFVPNPLNSNARQGDRLYRSGDRVIRRVDGGFDYLGRSDQQIKLRGLRIEPGEIESRLLQIKGVNEAVVAVIERHGQAHLVAYVGGETDVETMKQQLHAQLPDYLVPAAFAIVSKLPRLPSGKVDRQHLPEPIWPQQIYETEKAVAAIWAELLAIEANTIGRFDQFFALGGHSLLAARVVAKTRSLFDIDIDLQDFFKSEVLYQFAAYIEISRNSQSGNDWGEMADLLDVLEASV